MKNDKSFFSSGLPPSRTFVPLPKPPHPDAARIGRDAGIGTVLSNNPIFKIQFEEFIRALPTGWTGTCEDIREMWPHAQPRHHNAWGACWNAAKKRGELVELEHRVNMRFMKSHARMTSRYRKA
jgi:hypothetical protein